MSEILWVDYFGILMLIRLCIGVCCGFCCASEIGFIVLLFVGVAVLIGGFAWLGFVYYHLLVLFLMFADCLSGF